MDVVMLVSIILFYVIIAAAGIWAARMTRNRKSQKPAENMIVGAKDIGLGVGICTMTATWIGGGALNGTAETVHTPGLGLIWCVAPVSFGCSLMISGWFFADKMRRKNYLTVFDPICESLGEKLTLLYVFIEIFGVTVYAGAILNALGGTIEVVVGLSREVSIISSAAVATFYTLLGGFYAVAYTDVIELGFMVIGLVIATPFVISNEAVSSISESFSREGGWSGTWDPNTAGLYVDTVLSTLLGAVPMQVVFQRLLAMDTTLNAKIMSVFGTIFSILLRIPPVLIGAVASSTNWTLTDYLNGTGVSPADLGNGIQTLPIVIRYLTPTAVGVLGVGAITAAVMSSADAAGLVVGSVFGRNVYNAVLRPKASEQEVTWVIRLSILGFGIAAATIAIKVKSIMILYILCADLEYVFTLPQFVCSMYLDTNAYGTIIGIMVGILLRIGGGEYLLDLPPPFNYPGGGNFPVKSFAMALTFCTTVAVSYFMKWLLINEYIPSRFDVLKVKQRKQNSFHPATELRDGVKPARRQPATSQTPPCG